MSENWSKKLAKIASKDLEARQRGHEANDAAEPAITQEDVDAYTVNVEPKEGEKNTIPQKSREEWIQTLRETAGITEEEAEKKQREALLSLVKRDPRTGQKYE